MNKKVLTLCAGFLLAGGMLSSLSAEKLSEVANDGKYYKISRVAETSESNGNLSWGKMDNDYLLGLKDSKAGIAVNIDSYWRVTGSAEEGYTLWNINGEKLTVGESDIFYLKEDITTVTELPDGFSQLFISADKTTTSVGQELKDTDNDGFYELIARTDAEGNENAKGEGFDADETNVSLLNGEFEAVANGDYYYISVSTGANSIASLGDYKAVYNQGAGTWSFVSNDKDEKTLSLGGSSNFTLQSTGVEGQYTLMVGSQYISFYQGSYKLTDTPQSIFAFDKIDNLSQLKVKDLVYYDLDAFTLNIYYDADKKSVAGNPFEGRLTPMLYVGGRFIQAEDNAPFFYLKNEKGEYIVAKLYSKGNTSSQDVYTFTTVSEKTLLHYLSFFNNDKDPAYHGIFSAYSKAYKWDKKNLDVLDALKVSLPDGNAIVSRYEIDKVWTLAASVSTNMEAVTVAINPVSLVQAKKFLTKKFVTMVKTATTEPNGLKGNLAVNASGYANFLTSYGNELEGQWAITWNPTTNVYTLTNRENTSVTYTLDGNKLYEASEVNTYRYDIYTNGVFQYTDTYVIEDVKDAKWSDGYETRSNLKNVKFNIGYSSETFKGEAWFTENHEGVNNHTIGLDIDQENALTFTATEYSDAKKKVETPVHGYAYVPSDSIYVISRFGYINDRNEYKDDAVDTLKVVSYSFVNQWGEPLVHDGTKYVSSTNKKADAQKFVLRKDGDKLNLRPVELTQAISYSATDKMYNEFNNTSDLKKVYTGDTSNGIVDNTGLYTRPENDRFVVEAVDAQMYHRVANGIDTVSIYRAKNANDVLFEAKGSILEAANIAQFEVNPAMFVDTAYVRYNTYRPQYMLVVDPDITPSGMWCEIHQSSTCEHAVPTQGWIEGRYLVNLKDTAIAWDKANKHSAANPYINSEKLYKLGFVQAKHIGDSLIIASSNDTLNVGTEDFNVAKFAFRYVDQEAKTFVIETANYTTLNTLVPGARLGEGYLKHMNGTIVVTPDMDDAEVFTMNEDYEGQPTANEEISANAAVSVVATDGAVIVKGAEGKSVVVSTILGKVVANEVLNSDNETIAAPAGIVVVSVDGESFKVAVK